MFEEIVGQRRSDARVRVVYTDSDGVIVGSPVRIIHRRVQDFSVQFEHTSECIWVTQERTFGAIIEPYTNDETVRTVHDLARDEFFVEREQ